MAFSKICVSLTTGSSIRLNSIRIRNKVKFLILFRFFESALIKINSSWLKCLCLGVESEWARSPVRKFPTSLSFSFTSSVFKVFNENSNPYAVQHAVVDLIESDPSQLIRWWWMWELAPSGTSISCATLTEIFTYLISSSVQVFTFIKTYLGLGCHEALRTSSSQGTPQFTFNSVINFGFRLKLSVVSKKK